jgi:hypothetical protein
VAAGHLIVEDYVTPFSSLSSRLTRFALLFALALGATAGSAAAQSKPVVNAGIDFPTVYFFRGIRQEADPKFTTFVFGDVGFPVLTDGSGGLSSATINVGSWNAFLTGTSGSEPLADNAFYESDFYAAVTLGMSNGISITPMFTAYTSPNDVFTTVKEISFLASVNDGAAPSRLLRPYALFAFEFDTAPGTGQADGGFEPGKYLEVGVSPGLSMKRLEITVPVKLGLSLDGYYELASRDRRFGFASAAGVVRVPLGGRTGLGTWDVRGGVEYQALGEMTKAINLGDGSNVIGSIGIGWSR